MRGGGRPSPALPFARCRWCRNPSAGPSRRAWRAPPWRPGDSPDSIWCSMTPGRSAGAVRRPGPPLCHPRRLLQAVRRLPDGPRDRRRRPASRREAPAPAGGGAGDRRADLAQGDDAGQPAPCLPGERIVQHPHGGRRRLPHGRRRPGDAARRRARGPPAIRATAECVGVEVDPEQAGDSELERGFPVKNRAVVVDPHPHGPAWRRWKTLAVIPGIR